MNHDNTHDTEIVPGNEGDLTPIQDIGSEPNAGAPVDSGLSPAADDSVPAVTENEAGDVSPQPEVAVEEQVVNLDAPLVLTVPDMVEPRVSTWRKIRDVFAGGSVSAASRLDNLTQAIEAAPESPVNYILRAELYVTMREYALAQADFQRAVELADTRFELADWGLMDQVMRDRAITGLEKVLRRLR